MSAALERPHARFTVEWLHRAVEHGLLGEGHRIELLAGELLEMTPISPEHAELVQRLLVGIGRQLSAEFALRCQNPITLEPDSEPEPDLAVVRAGDYRGRHPNAADTLLVVEVMHRSERSDRDVKLPLYARHGIPEVWLISATTLRCEIHRLPTQAGYTEHQTIDLAARVVELTAVDLPSVTLDFRDWN